MATVTVLGLSALAACTSSSNSSGAAPASTSRPTGPITIGASLSLTGDFSADGQAFEKGYQLWARDVNAHGGILGRPVKLDILNDASSPNQVVTNYQRLTTVQGRVKFDALGENGAAAAFVFQWQKGDFR